MPKTITILSLILMTAACSHPNQGSDGPAFSSRSGEWQAAMNAKDPDALAALYMPDARVLPPNAAAKTGRDAVRAEFAAMIDAGLSIELTSIETRSGGDVAYNVGTYVLTAGDAVVDKGKFVETWNRTADGEWLMANDIWNSDMPAASGGDGNTHLLVVHEVENGDHWLAAWTGENSRRDQFKANGAAHVHTFRSADNPNLTGLVISVADIDAYNAFLGSEEGAAAAAADGVDLDNMTVLIETE